MKDYNINIRQYSLLYYYLCKVDLIFKDNDQKITYQNLGMSDERV